MTGARRHLNVLACLVVIAGCGAASQAPQHDTGEERWQAWWSRCKADPTPCREECAKGDRVACAVARDERIAKLPSKNAELSSDENGGAVTVPTILPARLPAPPGIGGPRSVPLVISEVAWADQFLAKTPEGDTNRKLALTKLAVLYTELALYSGPTEPDADKRPKLVRAAAVKALAFWSEATKAGATEDDKRVYTLGLLWEIVGRNDEAAVTYARVPKDFSDSKLVPLAYLGMGVVLDAKGAKDIAKKAYLACVNVPPWDNPVWEQARKLAGLPDSYETPKMIERREADEKAKAEALVAEAFSPVASAIDDIAILRFKIRFVQEISASKATMQAIPKMQADAEGRVKERYCPAKQGFMDEYGPDEFKKQATEKCDTNPPQSSGRAGVEVTLTADCKALAANPCAATPAKDSAFFVKKAAAKAEKDMADEGERKNERITETRGYSQEIRIACPDGSNVSIPHRFGCSCVGGASVDYPKGGKCQELTGMDGKFCIFTCE